MNYKVLIIPLMLLIIGVGCRRSSPFELYDSPNPWIDNYEELTKMADYPSWGTYNVHDPSCLFVDSCYYMYSTDAFLLRERPGKGDSIPSGFIQVRKSPDLVNWEFVGWAFPEIPAEAVEWVKSRNDGRGAHNIWAPYIIKCGDRFRLYFSVSAFGRNTSYIGLAESDSPEGPWTQMGCVVKTDTTSAVNAIDPTVIATSDGKWLMIYGSYFGGLSCLQLDPATGLALNDGDKGTVVARRANYKVDNLEAPEIIYNADLDSYYLFGSYEPLMTTYNVRVGRSSSPSGPFVDFFGKEMQDTTDNFPILTAPYRFDGHSGWAGTGHCSVFTSPDGRYFIAHQGRLAPANEMMVLHVRRLFFTPDGWTAVSPERYAGSEDRHFSAGDLAGDWEVIRIRDPKSSRGLEAGQVLWGEGGLLDRECAESALYSFDGNGNIGGSKGRWTFDGDSQLLELSVGGETIRDLIIHAGHDWEREKETILFTGLDSDGCSVWGKRVK